MDHLSQTGPRIAVTGQPGAFLRVSGYYVGGIDIPRIECNVNCEFQSGVNVNRVGKAISSTVRNLTGQPCQVVANSRDAPNSMGRVQLWQMQQRMRRGNIELMPPGR